MRKRMLTIVVAANLLVGCASTNITPWVGHNEAELVSSWGVPTSTLELKNGGRVLTYQTRGRNGCTPSFVVDQSGIITSTSSRNCF